MDFHDCQLGAQLEGALQVVYWENWKIHAASVDLQVSTTEFGIW